MDLKNRDFLNLLAAKEQTSLDKAKKIAQKSSAFVNTLLRTPPKHKKVQTLWKTICESNAP